MPSQDIPTELKSSSSDSSTHSDELSPNLIPPDHLSNAAANATTAADQTQNRLLSPSVAVAERQAYEQLSTPTHSLRRRFSFDRELAVLEEENHWPRQAYLLPVVLPQATEPTLDELLHRVTGRTDLQNVESVKLRVISYIVSLSRLSVFLPRLVHLDLSGSVLHSLRDLGCSLLHLTHLNVSNCGLSSFDGTSGMPGLRELIADGNMVQLVSPLTHLPMLRHLSARHNRICDVASLTFLGMCANLVQLELQGNPVANFVLYHLTLQRSVRSLELLDGEPFLAEVVNGEGDLMHLQDTTSTTSPSSLSSESFSISAKSDSSSSHSINGAPQRPASTCSIEIRRQVLADPSQQLRASSAFAASSLPTSRRNARLFGASPLAGSVVDVVRQRRRHGSSASSSDSSTSSLSLTSPRGRREDGSGGLIDSQRHVLPPLITPQLHSSLRSLEEFISN